MYELGSLSSPSLNTTTLQLFFWVFAHICKFCSDVCLLAQVVIANEIAMRLVPSGREVNKKQNFMVHFESQIVLSGLTLQNWC